MALITADRVLESSTTTGTGAYTLAGAKTGYRAASAVCVNGDTFTYVAEDVDGYGRSLGGWETGIGTWGTGGILTRTTIYASSNAGAAVSWGAGTRYISLTLVAASVISWRTDVSVISAATYNPADVNGTIILLCNTTSNNVTVTLPTAVNNKAIFEIKKTAAANSMVIDAAGTETIDGSLTVTVTVENESLTLVSDNTNWKVI